MKSETIKKEQGGNHVVARILGGGDYVLSMDYGSSVLDLKRKIKRQTKRTPTVAKAHPTISKARPNHYQSTPQPLIIND